MFLLEPLHFVWYYRLVANLRHTLLNLTFRWEEYMRNLIRSISLAIMALLIVSIYGCYHPCTMKVQPLGTLDSEDYDRLQDAASQSPLKVGSNIDNCVPHVVYYVADDYNFSRIRSIYVPDFRSLDEKADERVTKKTPDDLAALLLEKNLFDRVERTKSTDADIELDTTVVKYQEITAGQTAKGMLKGGMGGMGYCGFCTMEIKLIDSKTKIKIGAVQINHITVRAGGVFTWAGSRRPETQVPELLATVFEKIRSGQTAGTNGKFSDCTRVDNGKRLWDLMCK
jgi:hypothetical protein